MHVVFLTSEYMTPREPGILRAWQISRYLVARGHRVTVICSGTHYMTDRLLPGLRWRPYVKETEDGIEVIRTYALPDYRRSKARRVVNYLNQSLLAFVAGVATRDVDVVLAASPPLTTGLAGYLLARLKRATFVFEIRDLMPDTAVALGYLTNPVVIRLSTALERFLYNRADRIVAVTPGIKALIAEKGISTDKIAVVTNGFEEEIFSPEALARGPSVRAQLGISADAFVALYVGGLGQAYDISTLTRVAERLRDRPDIVFVVAGGGERKPEYVAFCEQRGLTAVRFLPPVPRDEIPGLCAAADVGVHLFRRHPFWRCVLGNKVFDYLGAGLPMIFAGEGDTAALIDAANAGIVVPPEDVEAFAAAIETLAKDRSAARAMGARGATYVRGHYSRQMLLAAMEDVLRKPGDARG